MKHLRLHPQRQLTRREELARQRFWYEVRGVGFAFLAIAIAALLSWAIPLLFHYR